MTFHRNAGETTAIISYTTGGGGVVIPVGTDGVLQVTIPNADVRKLPTSYSHWSIARTDAGQEAGLSRGLIWVEPV
jgi:hypothetical protein